MARILIIAACLCGSAAAFFSQAQNTPAPQARKQAAQPDQNRNPFEAIPPAPVPAAGPGVIEGIDFRGSRRIPQNALREAIFSRVGAAYDEDAVRRDVMVLRNTSSYQFDDVRVSTEEGKKGGVILHFVLTERPPTR